MKLTKNIWILFIFLMILTNMIVYLNYFVRQKETSIVLGEQLVSLTDEITIGKKVDTIFKGNNNKVHTIDVFFSTYNRLNQGTLTLTLYDNDKQLYSTTVDMSIVKDNEYHRFLFPCGRLYKEHYYRLVLSSDAQEHGISAWIDEDGVLVAKVSTIVQPTISHLLAINITYAVLNYTFCVIIKALRKR